MSSVSSYNGNVVLSIRGININHVEQTVRDFFYLPQRDLEPKLLRINMQAKTKLHLGCIKSSNQINSIFDRLFQNNFIPMPTVVIRRDALDEVGMFNPKYEIAEEYDLWLRVAEHYTIDFTEESLAKYRIHGGGVSRNQELVIDEDLQIVEYWLNRKSGANREFVGQTKRREA